MPDMSAIAAAFSSLKAMKDIAEAMIGLRDAAAFRERQIEFQGKVIDAQHALSSLQDERSALVERVGELEKQVADFEAWEAEKKNYDLKSVARSAFAYMLKPDARGTKPPHWLCTQCFQNKKRSIMQAVPMHRPDIIAKCPACLNAFSSHSPPAWIDEEARTSQGRTLNVVGVCVNRIGKLRSSLFR
jgi:hypothetical protein